MTPPRKYKDGDYVQHRDGTWGWVRGYSKDNCVIIQEETPSGKPVASEAGIDGLFKSPESSIVAADPTKNRTFVGAVEIKGSKYTVDDVAQARRGGS